MSLVRFGGVQRPKARFTLNFLLLLLVLRGTIIESDTQLGMKNKRTRERMFAVDEILRRSMVKGGMRVATKNWSSHILF